MRRLFQSNKSYLHEVSRFCIFFPVTINNYHYDYNLQYSITTGYFQLFFFFFFFFFNILSGFIEALLPTAVFTKDSVSFLFSYFSGSAG